MRIVIIAIILGGFAVSALAQSDTPAPPLPADSSPSVDTATPAVQAPEAPPAPDYKTARDIFLKTKKFKTPAEQVSRAKEFLAGLAAISSGRLNTLKDRLTASDMPQDQIDAAAAEIDKATGALNALTTDITHAATRADLTKVFTEAKSALKLARFTLKHQAVAFKLQRLGVVIGYLQTALEQAETTLNDLKIAGARTAAVATELADLKIKLAAIATSQKTAGSAIDALSIDKDFEATVNSAESITARVALSLRVIVNSAQALAAEVKALAPTNP